MANAVAVKPPGGERRIGTIPYKWVALGIVLLGAIMTILDATIVNIAINTLQIDFHVGSYADVAWVVTGYALAQGAIIPVTGWATDRFGTKRLFLTTIFLFTVASAACGLAGSLGELIAFRVMQGAAGGMIMPIGMTIILNVVGPQQMGKVMGLFGVPMLLAPAAGPILGGWFVQDFTWRLIFYVNMPIGLLALFLGWRLLVETPKRGSLKLDVTGLLCSTAAIVALMYAVDQSVTVGWGSPLIVSLLVGAAIYFAVFVACQLDHRTLGSRLSLLGAALALLMAVVRGAEVGFVTVDALSMFGFFAIGVAVVVLLAVRHGVEPLLHLELFKDGTFRASMILSFFIVTTMFGAMLLLPLFLQQVDGYGPLETGLFLLPQALTAAIAMPLGGYLSDRIGPRPVVITGMVLLSTGSLMLVRLNPGTSHLWLFAALGLRGFAMGCAMMPSQAAAFARIDRRFTSRASSITNSTQRIASAIGIAVLVTFLAAQFTVASQQASCVPSAEAQVAASAAHLGGTPAAVCAHIGQEISAAVTSGNDTIAPPATHNPLSDFIASFGNTTLSIAFDRTFFFIAVLGMLGIIPALFLKRPDKPVDKASVMLDAA